MKNVAFSSQGSTALPGRISFTLRSGLTTGAFTLLAMAGIAQNSSYNLNSVPIGGTDNSAFGFNSTTVTRSKCWLRQKLLRVLTSGGQTRLRVRNPSEASPQAA
ncbi:MAG: hypothetical protein U0176_15185 [Bacteroidia bacterium]